MAPNTMNMMDLLEHPDVSPTSSMVSPTMADRESSKRVAVTKENMLRSLSCSAQEYSWGKVGSTSTVAKMKNAQDSNFVIDESAPYAELWLGTHPNGMSYVSIGDNEQQTLVDYIQSNPKLHCGDENCKDLSFLFKVLSINKVLSIQAHPDKKLAERLHANAPHVYKDDNAKPEMAIALSEEVKAMCGFRPISEIVEHFEAYPELCELLGERITKQLRCDTTYDECRSVLQDMFQTYLHCSNECIGTQLTSLLNRLCTMKERNDLQELIVELADQFPGDAGIFAPLLFNIVTCKKGEAIFIDANEPHAYISGELLECMACSDNVVRAGLTPKLKDVDTLVDMLTYKSQSPDVYRGHYVDDYTRRYEPPVPDFCVEVITIPSGESFEIASVDSPSLLLTLSGSATLVQENVCSMDVSFGSAAFCSASTCTTIVAGPKGVQLSRALTNVFHDDE